MARTPDRFTTKVLEILKDPSAFPPEVSAWVRGLIARNPVVRLDASQLPYVDKKHMLGASGEPALQNSWVPYGAPYEDPSFFKDLSGVVHLQGLIKGGTVTVGTAIFTLPAAYRPAGQLVIDVQSNNAVGQLNILTSGVVQVQIANTAWINLTGISFRV